MKFASGKIQTLTEVPSEKEAKKFVSRSLSVSARQHKVRLETRLTMVMRRLVSGS